MNEIQSDIDVYRPDKIAAEGSMYIVKYRGGRSAKLGLRVGKRRLSLLVCRKETRSPSSIRIPLSTVWLGSGKLIPRY